MGNQAIAARAIRRVGLLAIGGPHWIAGVNYVTNLARALQTLPEGERPDVLLVENPDGQLDLYDDLGETVSRLRWGVHGKIPLLRRLWPSKSVLSPAQCMARQLRANDVPIIFPVKNRKNGMLGVPWIGWIVDFQHKYFPEFFDDEYMSQRDDLYRWLAVNSQALVLSSRCAVSDFNEYYPDVQPRLGTLRFRSVPPEHWFTADPVLTANQYQLPERYLMAPNQFFRHKNHRTLFEAIAILRDRGVDAHLVCTGTTHDFRHPDHMDNLRKLIEQRGITDRVRILGLIPREDQIQLLRRAMAVVQPSLFEGWSTVVEDARALGKTLFLSDLPVHREQSPRFGSYFNPHDPEDLSRQLAERWSDLVPGPVATHEAIALDDQRELVQTYAREFLEVCALGLEP